MKKWKKNKWLNRREINELMENKRKKDLFIEKEDAKEGKQKVQKNVKHKNKTKLKNSKKKTKTEKVNIIWFSKKKSKKNKNKLLVTKKASKMYTVNMQILFGQTECRSNLFDINICIRAFDSLSRYLQTEMHVKLFSAASAEKNLSFKWTLN